MIRKDVKDVLESIDENVWEKETLPIRRFMSYYTCAVMEIETKLKVLNQEFSLNYDKNPIDSIKTRIKSKAGIARKIRKRGLPLTLDAIEQNIFDIAGLRVICSFPEDVYLVERCLLAQDDIRLIRRKDYIKNPKPNGYRSLHLIVEVPIFLADEKKWVRAEVQLRTMAMDFWASLEHKLRYKKNLSPETEKEIAEGLQRAADTCFELDRHMEEIHEKVKKEL